MNEITKVIFRKYPEGDVIALFPEEPGDYRGNYCMSYMHVGQHGGADPGIVQSTKLATPEEYAPLQKELERIGYKLNIQKRFTKTSRKTRKAKILESIC